MYHHNYRFDAANILLCPLCSGLVMLQTTNAIYNKTLYDYSTPKALLAWHRVRLANWLAEGGKDWADIFSRYNSGTHVECFIIIICITFYQG